MDKPAYSELRQITRHGTQVFVNLAAGTVTGNFYAVEIFVPTEIKTITIDGQEETPLDNSEVQGGECDTGITLYNVSSIFISAGFAICYTATPLTGQIES
tara:strand:- start:461 stop:760 length:300 start_codon:yes stop_codon:yes gene_type:complete